MIIIHQQYPLVEVLLVLVLVWQNSIPNVISVVEKKIAPFILYYYQGRPFRECQHALAPLVFWSRSLKKSRKVSKSKSCSLEWHQLFLPSFGANDYIGNDFTKIFEFENNS